MLSKWITVICILLTLTGCKSIGPKQVNVDRGRYNETINNTNNQQLLSNIVRLRYVEPTFFMKLSNVTSSYILESSVNNNGEGFFGITDAVGSARGRSLVTQTAQVAPGILYSDRPTISYIPVEDAEFASQLLTPLTLDSVQLLFYGGIDEPSTLMRLIVQSINDLDNASSASSAKLPRLPRYKQYYEFVRLIMDLYKGVSCELLPAQINAKPTLSIHFSKGCLHSPDAVKIRKMLNATNPNKDIIFTEGPADPANNLIHIRMRSILGMMTYLSYAVQIPPSDIERHKVYEYYTPDGQLFDWSPLMNGLMNIYSSDTEPYNVFVKTYEHNHWFYIKNSDLDSKATFTLLVRLITLTAGKELAGGAGPALTLPAG